MKVNKKKEKAEKQTSRWALDARQSIKNSNNLQSLLGQLIEKLTPESEWSKTKDALYEKKDIIEFSEKFKEHFLMMTKGMPDKDLRSMLENMRTLTLLIDKLDELLSEEAILRKSKPGVSGFYHYES